MGGALMTAEVGASCGRLGSVSIPMPATTQMPTELTNEMERCIRDCLECYRVCVDAAINHQLGVVAGYMEPAQIRLLLACAEICQTTATLVQSGSPLHKPTCRVAAKLCRRCASECERLGNLEECLRASRHCADSCQRVAA